MDDAIGNFVIGLWWATIQTLDPLILDEHGDDWVRASTIAEWALDRERADHEGKPWRPGQVLLGLSEEEQVALVSTLSVSHFARLEYLTSGDYIGLSPFIETAKIETGVICRLPHYSRARMSRSADELLDALRDHMRRREDFFRGEQFMANEIKVRAKQRLRETPPPTSDIRDYVVSALEENDVERFARLCSPSRWRQVFADEHVKYLGWLFLGELPWWEMSDQERNDMIRDMDRTELRAWVELNDRMAAEHSLRPDEYALAERMLAMDSDESS